jgi:alpha-1,2-mannosyltransferase
MSLEITAGGAVRRRWVVQILIVLALAAASWALVSAIAVRHGSFDLKVYFGAVNYWVHGDGQIYDYLKPYTKYGFTYPPFAALTMTPMAFLPWWLVNALSNTATVVVSLVVLAWYLVPVADRYGWPRWFTLAIAACLAAVFEPLRETVSFGQVNMLLLFLVLADFRLLIGRRSRFGGVAIGLATAVKLTPGIFVLYLLITRRYRQAATALATTAAATVFAMLVAPDASRDFWTDALWDTDRVGSLSFISNQSLMGMVARFHQTDPSTGLWIGLVLSTLGLWAWRVREAQRAGDEAAGVALTGLVGCLVSPVTWVHHLVWLMPALLLLFDRGLVAAGRQRQVLLTGAVGLYVLLCSRWVWRYGSHFSGTGVLGSNLYLLATMVLLVGLPVGGPAEIDRPAPDAGELETADDGATGSAGRRVARGGSDAPAVPAGLATGRERR